MTRSIDLPGLSNLRDLGGIAAPGGATRAGRALRSDSPHRLDPAGQADLLGRGLVLTVDLRGAAEAARRPNPFAGTPGVVWHNIPVFDGIVPRAGAGDILADMYLRALAERGAAFGAVMTAIADAPEGAVLFHCAAGKDRTGIIAALLLSLAGVDRSGIVADYALTAERLAPIRDDLIAGALAEGFTREDFLPLLECAPATMDLVLDGIGARYGSVADYLRQAGVAPGAIARLEARLAA